MGSDKAKQAEGAAALDGIGPAHHGLGIGGTGECLRELQRRNVATGGTRRS
jgi:hypothetical protein